MNLDRDDAALALGVKDGVDPTPCRLSDRDLRVGLPPRVKVPKKGFEDRGLVPISDGWASARIQPRAQVRAKHESELGVRLDRAPLGPVLDATEKTRIDAGPDRQRPPGQPPVLAESPNVPGQYAMGSFGGALRRRDVLGEGMAQVHQMSLTRRSSEEPDSPPVRTTRRIAVRDATY